VVRSTRQTAQGLTEYGLILTLTTFVAIVGLTFFGGALGTQLGVLLSNLGASV
jgi:Flp pilus assembly pilin Flp